MTHLVTAIRRLRSNRPTRSRRPRGRRPPLKRGDSAHRSVALPLKRRDSAQSRLSCLREETLRIAGSPAKKKRLCAESLAASSRELRLLRKPQPRILERSWLFGKPGQPRILGGSWLLGKPGQQRFLGGASRAVDSPGSLAVLYILCP